MKRRYETEGLELVGIEDYPPMDKTRLGLPGRDEEIDAFCTLVRNMGTIRMVRLSHDGDSLAVATADMRVHVWDMKSRMEFQPLKGHIDAVTGHIWSLSRSAK